MFARFFMYDFSVYQAPTSSHTVLRIIFTPNIAGGEKLPYFLAHGQQDSVLNLRHTLTRVFLLKPFRTAVPFGGQTSKISSSLSPKRDCGSKFL